MRFSALDGLRGVCAIFVALFHFNYASHLYALPLIRNAWLFVDFFFVLSGFVITHAYREAIGKTISLPSFMLKRFARLWPLHMVMLAALILNELAKLLLHQWFSADHIPFTEDTSLPAFFSNILLLHATGIHDRLTWNFPSWSISAEFYTCLVFAYTIGVLQKHVLRFFVFFAISSALLLFLYSPDFMHTTYQFGFFRCLCGFSIGCLAFYLYNRTKETAPYPWLEPFAILTAFGFVCYCDSGILSFAAPLVFAFVVYIFAFERGAVSALLRISFLQKLGVWSYSIYMVHHVILVCLSQCLKILGKIGGINLTTTQLTDAFGKLIKQYSFGSAWAMDGLEIAYIAVVVAIAAKTYRYIELPGQTYFNRLSHWRFQQQARPA